MSKKQAKAKISRARIIERAEANLFATMTQLGMPDSTAWVTAYGHYDKMTDSDLAIIAAFTREDWIASALYVGNKLVEATQKRLENNEGTQA